MNIVSWTPPPVYWFPEISLNPVGVGVGVYDGNVGRRRWKLTIWFEATGEATKQLCEASPSPYSSLEIKLANTSSTTTESRSR